MHFRLQNDEDTTWKWYNHVISCSLGWFKSTLLFQNQENCLNSWKTPLKKIQLDWLRIGCANPFWIFGSAKPEKQTNFLIWQRITHALPLKMFRIAVALHSWQPRLLFCIFYKTYFVKKTKNISKLKFLRKIDCDWQYDKKLFWVVFLKKQRTNKSEPNFFGLFRYDFSDQTKKVSRILKSSVIALLRKF